MADIVLATLNARYIHSALGLRCLQANLGALQPRSVLVEFTIDAAPLEVAEALLAHRPQIIGLGVYVWNTTQTLALVQLLRVLAPEVSVVLGGPEISHESRAQPLFALADHVIAGEGERAFAALCARLLAERPATEGALPPKLIEGGLPDLADLKLPYDLYTDADIAHRVLYVEASRGCPFRCAFCLSALDAPVRPFPLEAFLAAMQRLLARGARRFKFVDRTFNLAPAASTAVLDFFLAHIARQPDAESIFLHFEMVPDRFPEALRGRIAAFPAGAVQLEVGIQTLQPQVAARVDRRQDTDIALQNLRWLVAHTGAHLHADLIVGLPGEDLAAFGRGFDRLLDTGVHEIQVGILKRLRGAPIAARAEAWQLRFSPLPPYELLASPDLSADEMARMRRFARTWDLFGNSGRFTASLPLLLEPGSAFEALLAFSDWLHAHLGRTHALSLQRCVQALFAWLVEALGRDPAVVAEALAKDYRRVSRKSHLPAPLRAHLSEGPPPSAPPAPAANDTAANDTAVPTRQRRHRRP